MTSELTHLPVSELASRIRRRQISSVELTEAHLRRIEALNPALNAIVQLDAEGALAAARRADAALTNGDDVGPLHGVPFTAKDWLETEGLICAAGIAERASYRPRHDATVVARMRRAGAVLLGKTNVSDGSPVYARPENPYLPGRTPGGSSSGDAVAVAAGLSPLGICSDSGGSIRLPAGWCGVAALKPTTGRVPLTGHFPRITAMTDPRTQIGPIARSAADLYVALTVIGGTDWRDAGVVSMPLGDPSEVDLSGMRAAVYVDVPETQPTPETAAAVRAASDALAAAGVELHRDRPPRIEEALPITQAYWSRPESMSWNSWVTFRESRLSADEVERSLFEWDRLRRAFIEFMEGYDIIVCPVAAAPAPEHRPLTPADYVYTLPYSLTGYPCTLVRCGTSPEGLPLSVQLVARPWRDDVAIAAAVAVERALGGWVAAPAHPTA